MCVCFKIRLITFIMLYIATCTSEKTWDEDEKKVADELNKGNDQCKGMLHIMLCHFV